MCGVRVEAKVIDFCGQSGFTVNKTCNKRRWGTKKVQYVRPGILSSSLIPVVVNQCHNQGAAALLCLVWTQGTLGCCHGFNNSHLSVCFRVMIVHNVDSSRPVTVDPLINLNWPRHDVPSTVSKYWAGGSSFSWGRRRRISPVVAWPWFVVDYHKTKTS